MNKYGLSYFNEEDRIRFIAFRKERGQLMLKNNLWLAKTAVKRQKAKDKKELEMLRLKNNK